MEVENHNDLMPFWLQVLLRLKGQNGGIKFGCRFSLAMPASVLPSAAELRDVRTVEHLRGLALPNPLWESLVRQVGDPGGNLRLLAALPRSVVVQASVQASSETGEGFSAIQAHVGLVWGTSQKVLHHWAGLPEEEFVDMDLGASGTSRRATTGCGSCSRGDHRFSPSSQGTCTQNVGLVGSNG